MPGERDSEQSFFSLPLSLSLSLSPFSTPGLLFIPESTRNLAENFRQKQDDQTTRSQRYFESVFAVGQKDWQRYRLPKERERERTKNVISFISVSTFVRSLLRPILPFAPRPYWEYRERRSGVKLISGVALDKRNWNIRYQGETTVPLWPFLFTRVFPAVSPNRYNSLV